jgi:hypothetical protein
MIILLATEVTYAHLYPPNLGLYHSDSQIPKILTNPGEGFRLKHLKLFDKLLVRLYHVWNEHVR